MGVKTLSSAKRLNVQPTSDLLYARIEDVDCSGSDFDALPEDGQFVLAPGRVAECKAAASGDPVFQNSAAAPSEDDGDVSLRGSALRMVWSGGAARSDQQALGGKRVPIFRSAVRVRTKLFNVLDDAAALATTANGYTVGSMVGVARALAAVQGSQNRLVLHPIENADATLFWAVGRVTRVVVDSVVAGVGELEIDLFETPQFINNAVFDA